MCLRLTQKFKGTLHFIKMKGNREEDVPISPEALCFQWNVSKRAIALWGVLEKPSGSS